MALVGTARNVTRFQALWTIGNARLDIYHRDFRQRVYKILPRADNVGVKQMRAPRRWICWSRTSDAWKFSQMAKRMGVEATHPDCADWNWAIERLAHKAPSGSSSDVAPRR